MDTVSSVSVQDIANIIIFIAPGYFAMAIYSLRFAKTERAFSKLTIESIAWSLPLLAFTNVIWEKLLHQRPVSSINTKYSVLLLFVSALAGLLLTELRLQWPIKTIANRMGLGSPDEDFLRSHFAKLKPTDAVLVALKSGKTFSGTPSAGSIHGRGSSRKYCFDHIAWYSNKRAGWVVPKRAESIVIELSEVEYLLTPTSHSPKKTRPQHNKLLAAIAEQWQNLGQ